MPEHLISKPVAKVLGLIAAKKSSNKINFSRLTEKQPHISAK